MRTAMETIYRQQRTLTMYMTSLVLMDVTRRVPTKRWHTP